MSTVKNLQSGILAYLKRRHAGQEKAVPSRALEARFCVSGATNRRAVRALRRQGEPVCSDRLGYYYAANAPELWRVISGMEGSLAASAQVVRGLRKSAAGMPDTGQTRLDE